MDKIKVNSKYPPGTKMPIDMSRLEFCNADYMRVKEPGGDLLIPDNYALMLDPDGCFYLKVKGFMESLKLNELNVYEDCYWYLSIKKGYVNPGQYQTKDEWHIDGFLRDDYNFIWCDSLPTLVTEGTFLISPDRYKSLGEYGEQVTNEESVMPQYLYYLDRECVHKPAVNTSDEVIIRTLFKLTITKRLFNSLGNAWNYKIPHIIPTGERSNFK